MREKQDYRNNLEAIMQAYPNNKVLTVNQVAQYLNIRRQTVTELINNRELAGADVGRGKKHKIYRVSREALARFLS